MKHCPNCGLFHPLEERGFGSAKVEGHEQISERFRLAYLVLGLAGLLLIILGIASRGGAQIMWGLILAALCALSLIPAWREMGWCFLAGDISVNQDSFRSAEGV